MATPKTKTDSAVAEIEKRTTALIAQQVDELGDLERTLAPHRLAIAREETLRKLIRTWYDNKAEAEPFEARGTRYVVLLGVKALQATVDMTKLARIIGLKKLLEFASVTLAGLEKHAPGLDVVTKAHTGTRSLKVFELGK